MIKQTQNIKVGGRSNNLKLKAQSLKRQVISRFQLLIIYMNFMQKTNKKVGGVFPEIRSRKVGKKTAEKSEGAFTWKLGLFGSPASKWGEMMREVGVMGVVFGAVVLAVWGVMPAGAAEEAFSLKTI